MAAVYIGLGSNLGNREANLEHAMRLFSPEFAIRKTSPLFETDMLYRLGTARYFNMVCRVETGLSREQVFEKCRMIEKAMGRRSVDTLAPRVIDVELLLYDDVVLRTATLTIPHPQMHVRAFVLVPLSRIAPELLHPVLRKPIKALVRGLGNYALKITEIDGSI